MHEASYRDRFSIGVFWVCAVLLCLAPAGCGGGKDFIKTYPAKGKATFRGKPMKYAQVTLHAADGDEKLKKLVPHGQAGDDGTFVMGTYRFDDGVPAGEYKATIVWPNGPEEQCESPGYIADQLRGRYANAQASTLQVTIEEGDNELPPFDLQ